MSGPSEAEIQADIRATFARVPWIILWRNNTGQLRDERGQVVNFGLCVGSSDLVGIVRRNPEVRIGTYSPPVGVFLAIEVKRPGKTPTEDQYAFIQRVVDMGGIAGWCSSVLGAIAIVSSACGPNGNPSRDANDDLIAAHAAMLAAKHARAERRARGVVVK